MKINFFKINLLFALIFFSQTLYAQDMRLRSCKMDTTTKALASLFMEDSGQKRTSSKMYCDPILSEVAKLRAKQVSTNFAHTNVNGQVRAAGYPLPEGWPDSANNVESLAGGTLTPTATWKALKASTPHRTHLLGLNDFFRVETAFGVGYYYDPKSVNQYYWVIITAPARPQFTIFMDQSVPSEMNQEASKTATITFRNVGAEPIVAPLAVANEADSKGAIVNIFNKAPLPLKGTSIAPGEDFDLQMQIKAPSISGTFPFSWRIFKINTSNTFSGFGNRNIYYNGSSEVSKKILVK